MWHPKGCWWGTFAVSGKKRARSLLLPVPWIAKHEIELSIEKLHAIFYKIGTWSRWWSLILNCHMEKNTTTSTIPMDLQLTQAIQLPLFGCLHHHCDPTAQRGVSPHGSIWPSPWSCLKKIVTRPESLCFRGKRTALAVNGQNEKRDEKVWFNEEQEKGQGVWSSDGSSLDIPWPKVP